MTRSNASRECWIIGAGRMAGVYAEALKSLGVGFSAVCRRAESAEAFTSKTGAPCFHGGLAAALDKAGAAPERAIVAVDVHLLADTCRALMAEGTRHILVEKPGAATTEESEALAREAAAAGATIHVAYNRRYYETVKRLRTLAEEDGGVVSFAFEFTEVSDLIAGLSHATVVKENWLLANSTHVIDTAFLIGGEPARFFSHVNGSLPWHARAARFVGAGETASGALFSYFADWDAPGRWGIDVNTRKRRLILRPMEKLAVQTRGSFSIEEIDLGDNPDKTHKPGIYGQTRAFMTGEDASLLLSIGGHARKCRSIYEPMLRPWTLTGAGA